MSETDWGAFQRWWIDTYCQDGAYRKMDDVAWAAWQAGASASSSPAPAAEPVPADRAGLVEECKLRVRAVRDESWHSAHGAQGVDVGQRLDEAFAAIDRLASSAAQVSEDARDAARYRWLRDKSATAAQSTPTVLARFPLCDEDHPMLGGLDLDEAIDLLLGFAAPAAGGEHD